jgi:hypothetical protein
VKHIGIVIIADGISALWLLSCYLWRYTSIVITLELSLTYWYCDYSRVISDILVLWLLLCYLWHTGIVITLVLSLTYLYCDYFCVISDGIPALWLLSCYLWHTGLWLLSCYLWHTGIVITLVLSLIYWYCDYSRVICSILVLWLLSCYLWHTGIVITLVLFLILYRYCDYSRDYRWQVYSFIDLSFQQRHYIICSFHYMLFCQNVSPNSNLENIDLLN